jgi:hypothetical protein
MRFDYVRDGELVARGEQQVAWFRREGDELAPAPVPEQLRAALEPYSPVGVSR